MAIKSLTITEEAYNLLKRFKYEEESFTEAILRIGKGKSSAIDKYFGILKLSEKEAEEWKNKIKKRRKEVDTEFKQRLNKLGSILPSQK